MDKKRIWWWRKYHLWISFERNTAKGEKNENGKEDDEDGHIIFEGEYKNHEKWNGIRKDF